MDPTTYTGPPKAPDVFYVIPQLGLSLNSTHPHYGDPNYAPENIGGILFGLSIGTMVLAGTAVLLRLFTRFFLVWGLGSDDWVIVVAAVLCLGLTITNCLSTTLGKFGLFIYDMTLRDLIYSYRLYFAHFILYYLTLLMVKTSILLFYRRLLGQVRTTLQRVIMALFISNIALTVAQLLQLLLQCTPTHAVYDPVYQSKHPKACGWGTPKQVAMIRLAYYVLMPSHLLIDVLILLSPMKVVFQLPLPKAQKTAVRALFGLAAFACVACAVRLYYVYRLIFRFSPYHHQHFDVICWGQVEATVGLAVACAPSIRPFFTRLIPKLRGQRSGSNGPQYQRSTSGTVSAAMGTPHMNPHSTTGSSICNEFGTDLECRATSHTGQVYGLAYPYLNGAKGSGFTVDDALRLDEIGTASGYLQCEEEMGEGAKHKTKPYAATGEKQEEYLGGVGVSTKSSKGRVNSGSTISAFTANSSVDDRGHGEPCDARDVSVGSEISLRRDYASEMSI